MQKIEGILQLEGMEFHAFHGCLEKERLEGNLFTVDVKTKIDMSVSAISDRLEDTVDYGLIYDIVSNEMAKPSNLLENVAWRILKALTDTLPQLSETTVRVSKQEPPVNGLCRWSRISVSQQTSETSKK